YLKKKVPLGSIERPREIERMVVKATDEATAKDPQTSESAYNLKIVTFIKKDNKEKDKKYDRYAARREERNLRTKALGRYIFGISKERNIRPRVLAPIIFIDEDLATIKVPHAEPLIIKIRIGDAIVCRS